MKKVKQSTINTAAITPPKLDIDYWHEEVIKVSIEMLKPYPNHPFKRYSSERLQALADSICRDGLQQPVIAWDVEGQFEYTILSGHNRVEAMRLLGKDKVPAIIRKMDTNTAALTVVQTNLDQRERLLPSEKARAYKMQLEALQNLGCSDAPNDTEGGGHDVPVPILQIATPGCIADSWSSMNPKP